MDGSATQSIVVIATAACSDSRKLRDGSVVRKTPLSQFLCKKITCLDKLRISANKTQNLRLS